MSSDTPVQIIVAAFDDDAGASAALGDLKQASEERLVKIKAAAVLRKDADGKLHIKETADMGGGKGASLGGVAGAAIGLLAGPALIVPAAVGALIGGLAAKARDSGLSDEELKRIGLSLTPNSSALIAIVEHVWVDEVKQALARAGAEMLTQQLQIDIAEQLEAGHDVAYTALATSHGFAAGRIAGGNGETEGSIIAGDEDQIMGTQWIATDQGFAAQPDPPSAGSAS